MKDPDVKVTVIKAKGYTSPSLDIIEKMVETRGEDEHVLYVVVELTSDLEQRLIGMKGGLPLVNVEEA